MWSEPLLFLVEEHPAGEDLAWALEVVRRSLQRDGALEGDEPGAPPELDVARGGVEARAPGALGEVSDGLVRTKTASFGVSSPAALKVAGEVRTIDPADPDGMPLVWGRGRADRVYGRIVTIDNVSVEVPCESSGVRYGLSAVATDWGSAADACPVGTWVCPRAVVDDGEICDTVRPDDLSDAANCAGTDLNFVAHLHVGWTADVHEDGKGYTVGEGGGFGASTTCASFPVWCCWK